MATFVTEEITSQPDSWRRTIDLLPTVAERLPATGAHTAVVGCGTSWFMSMAYAALRERAGLGQTDAFAGSEVLFERAYDRAVLITRSGTTTEIIRCAEAFRARGIPTVVITAVADSPVAAITDAQILLDFADERSVLQTRFATSVLTLLRVHLGHDLDAAIADAQRAIEVPLDGLDGLTQTTFVGTGWTVGLAHEAALKTREAAQYWSEAYPAMDYRHGPISIAEPGRAVWAFGSVPAGLDGEIQETGATFVQHDLDPVAQLIVAQRFAVALATARGLDPDFPRNLTRAVHLKDDKA